MTVLVGQRRLRPQHAPRHRAQSRNPCPLGPNPHHYRSTRSVIPRTVAESISACQRQRSQHPLHSTMDTATSRSMTVLCGVTVCAGTDDGVGRATASPPPTRSPSLRTPPVIPKYPQHPNFVIPRAVAESISACQRINQRSQHPLHSTMDTATSRSMTVLCGVTVCPGTDDVVGRATASPPPTRSPSLRTPPVIPEVPAAPKYRHSARSRGIHAPLAPTPTITEVPAEPKLRHSARSRGIHLRLPTHQPEKPAPSALHYGYCDFAQYDGVVWGDGVCGNG